MGNCGGKPIAKETIDESQKSHQQIPKALIRSEVRKSVRHVDLSGNSIKEIDSKFWLNENIVEINISKNATFCAIPAELAKLSKLERLDLSHTGVTKIPDFVWTMQSLKILNISGTKVSSLGLLAENNIASLDISGLGLTELPASVSAFKNLQVLNAAGNKLVTLPDGISKCEKLKELNLEDNPLTHLPFAENLQKLEVLKITKDQKEKAVTLHESIYKEKKCLTCTFFKSGAAPVAPKRSESLAKKNEEAEMNVTIVTATTEVKAAPRMMEPPKIVIDEFEENAEIKEEKTDTTPEAGPDSQEIEAEIEKKDKADEKQEDDNEEKRSRKSSSSSSSSSSSESEKSCSDCDVSADEQSTEKSAEIEAEEIPSQVSAAVLDEEKASSEEQKATDKQNNSPSQEPAESEEREESAEMTVVIEKEEKSEITPESPKPEIAPKPKSVSFSIEEYPGEVDHVVEQVEVTESKEEGEEGVKITKVTTTVTTVINGDENSNVEETEKSENISVSENAKPAQNPANSENDNFQSEIIRSRGVGSVKRSMMMFMAEQEKAAASKSSAARSVKKMPAFIDYQTDQPSITGAGVVRVAVPIPQNFVEPKKEKKPIKTGRIDQIYDDAPEPEPTLKFIPNKPSMELVSSTPKPAEDHKARVKIAASEEARAIVASAATRNASIENEDEIFAEKNFDKQVTVEKEENVETEVVETENGILTTEVTTTKTTTRVSAARNVTYSHQETIDYDDREVTQNEFVNGDLVKSDMSFGDIKIEDEHLRPPSSPRADERTNEEQESKIELTILDILKQTHFDEEPQEIVVTAKRERGASLGLSITNPTEEPAVDVPLAGDTVIVKSIIVSSGTTFNQSPKIGDVLVSIDGIEINSSNIESELQNCGNLITLKFKRFPSAFSGYN